MSLIDQLSKDFTFMLNDWGETITFVNVSSQSLNPATGDYTTITNNENVDAIVETINRKEVELNPSKFRTSDLVFRFRSSDVSNPVNVNDEIQYSGNSYKVIDFSITKKIYKVFARKAE